MHLAESSLNNSIRTTIESMNKISKTNNWIQATPSPVGTFFFEIEKETEIFLQTTSSLETVGENNSLASDDDTVNLEMQEINIPSSRRIERSSTLGLDKVFKDKSVKMSASNINFDNFANHSQNHKIDSSSEIVYLNSGQEVKISQPVADLNITNFFSELENFGHKTNPSSKDQFSINGQLSHSHNLEHTFKRDSNSAFLQFQNVSSTKVNHFMDFYPNNLNEKIVDLESLRRNITSVVKKRKNLGTDLSKGLFTKVIRKRSNPGQKTVSENYNSDIYNDNDNHENVDDYLLKNEFLGGNKDIENIDEKAYRGSGNIGNKTSILGNSRFDNIKVKEGYRVENQPRWMDRENIQPGEKEGLFSIFGPRNLAGKKNQKREIDSNKKWKKLNQDTTKTAKNIKEVKFVVNQETSNQVSEPIEGGNLKHSERKKHHLPEKISKGGALKLTKKSYFGSKHSKTREGDKHIKKMRSKPKLSTSDLKIKSSKNRKKHSKGKKSSKKKRGNKNEKETKHRGVKTTFTVPEEHIHNDLTAGKLSNEKLKKAENKIAESWLRVGNNLQLINTNDRVKANLRIKKQTYLEGNDFNEGKDLSNKVKVSRLGDSLEDNHQSDEEKYDKPGYIRLGRRLQSLSGLAGTKTEIGKIRLDMIA